MSRGASAITNGSPRQDHDSSDDGPILLHSLHELGSSVLSLAADAKHIYSGSQSEDILVWCKKTFKLLRTLKGHTGSILSLECAAEKKWLFSSSGDSTVLIWSTETFKPLYAIHPYLETDAGDLFSLSWCNSHQIIYIGCQNTSLQWYSFSGSVTDMNEVVNSGVSTPIKKPHKFFDSRPRYVEQTEGANSTSLSIALDTFGLEDGYASGPEPLVPYTSLNIPGSNVIDSAHYGYIYCMAVLPISCPSITGAKSGHTHLVTGSGDETIKLWQCSNNAGPTLNHTLPCNHGAVLSLVVSKETIYAGCQDGFVVVWDVETKTLIRTIIVEEGVDIISLSMIHNDLYTCSANGYVQRWSASFTLMASWLAHPNAIVLSSIVTHGIESKKYQLITGGNDDHIKVWGIEAPSSVRLNDTGHASQEISKDEQVLSAKHSLAVESILYDLAKFVGFPSVSSLVANREDCRQAALWLKRCFNQLGAQSTLLPTGEGINPLVLATFSGAEQQRKKSRVLFYGHYDVVPGPAEGWDTQPFALAGRNGYLYGRGASDNKGPIMAVAYAAADLLRQRSLDLDLVCLIEGEEEYGSRGFADAVKRYKDLIGPIDVVLVSNSSWITEEQPCITYGLRGVIHAQVAITSNHPDLHSGIEGGAMAEPMLDMVNLLASLTDQQAHVKIPKFYDSVRAQTEEEKKLYEKLAGVTKRTPSTLSARWREPSLTIHHIDTSRPKNPTVIPGQVSAEISVRIVPDQDINLISSSLLDYLRQSFKRLDSPNILEVSMGCSADWWLGDLNDRWFRAMESAIEEEWGVPPLRIREGGSIPSIPYLEKEFGCGALQLPLGQSSDQAHLPNERISLTNLSRGKSVIQRFLTAVASKDFL